jgi:16S rRNA (guanine966-N2)-methyltransferase
MSLRITGGSFKGRLLKAPTGPLSRPTMSVMRKAVFDICQSVIEEAIFLDLFACSGAMGIEAISRGALHATFIEKDKKTAGYLIENIKMLQIEKQTTLLLGDVLTQLKRLKPLYHILYIDPPYPFTESADKPLEKLLRFFDTSSLLAENSLIFIEERAPGTLCASLPLSHLLYKNTRQFGSSLLHQWEFSSKV